MSESKDKTFYVTFNITDYDRNVAYKTYRVASLDEAVDFMYTKHVESGGLVSGIRNSFEDEDGDDIRVTLTVTPDMIPAYRQEREQQRILAQKQQQLDEEIADMIERLGKEEVIARLKGYE